MIRVTLALLFTLALGIASRVAPLGHPLFDKSLGDLLYALAAYLFLALGLRREAFPTVCGAALLFCLGIELFKLTGLPLRWRHFTASRWVLGTTFSWHNLVCYLAGITLATLADRHCLRPVRAR